MKLFSILAAIFFLAFAATAQRLPQTVTPDSYQLRFAPDLSSNTFAGEETIQVKISQPTNEIVLHAAEINFQSVSIVSGGSTQEATVTLDAAAQMAKLLFPTTIPAGPASIRIRYTGTLNDQLRGFYIGKDDRGEKYAATQFEDTDARRAFPSFDEPAFKATFDVTVVAEKDLTVISNGKILSDTPGPGDTKHTVHFSTTPKMSSYLVAVLVGHFEYIEGEADGIPIRVWTTPGKKELSTFALEAAEFNLKYYDHYFGIKYPYGKLDLVGLEDFSPGAMENTGCIVFRDLLLLLDEKHTGLELKKIVASVIAHEMAHQWFGDLVTMQWWDYKWLNEGFATWMSNKPVEAWKPEWHVELDAVSRAVYSLDQDSLINTHPIHQRADTPAEILEIDDSITYGKTAAVLQMMESYLGPEPFRAGVNLYLKQHSYGNATSSDFWNAETQASGKPADKVMPTWIDQAGAPILSVKTKCAEKSEKVTLDQQRYFYDREKMEEDSPELWQIPLCLKMLSKISPNSDACKVLAKKEESFTLQGCPSWIHANANAAGFYRSSYSPAAIESMSKVAESALSAEERLILLSDVWASVAINREPIGDYLILSQGMRTEPSSAVFKEVLKRLTYIRDYIASDADREAYARWVRQLLRPMAQTVGWTAKPGESEDRAALRAELLEALGGVAGDPEAQAIAQKLSNQYLENPDSVEHGLAGIALQVAARSGDEVLYEKIMQKLQNINTPEAYFNFVLALTKFSTPKLVERTLEYAISPKTRSQDALIVVSRVMANPDAAKQAWGFVQASWPRIETLGGPFAGGTIVQATGGFCDPAMRDEVQAFFTSHHAPAAERGLKQSTERMNYCVDLKAQQQSQLSTWLKSAMPRPEMHQH